MQRGDTQVRDLAWRDIACFTRVVLRPVATSATESYGDCFEENTSMYKGCSLNGLGEGPRSPCIRAGNMFSACPPAGNGGAPGSVLELPPPTRQVQAFSSTSPAISTPLYDSVSTRRLSSCSQMAHLHTNKIRVFPAPISTTEDNNCHRALARHLSSFAKWALRKRLRVGPQFVASAQFLTLVPSPRVRRQ